MKVVINKCFGGFSLSQRAEELLTDVTHSYDGLNEYRSDPRVVTVVEQLGAAANGRYAKLKVVEIPFDTVEGWHIDEYDGMEKIVETSREWI